MSSGTVRIQANNWKEILILVHKRIKSNPDISFEQNWSSGVDPVLETNDFILFILEKFQVTLKILQISD